MVACRFNIRLVLVEGDARDVAGWQEVARPAWTQVGSGNFAKSRVEWYSRDVTFVRTLKEKGT